MRRPHILQTADGEQTQGKTADPFRRGVCLAAKLSSECGDGRGAGGVYGYSTHKVYAFRQDKMCLSLAGTVNHATQIAFSTP